MPIQLKGFSFVKEIKPFQSKFFPYIVDLTEKRKKLTELLSRKVFDLEIHVYEIILYSVTEYLNIKLTCLL